MPWQPRARSALERALFEWADAGVDPAWRDAEFDELFAQRVGDGVQKNKVQNEVLVCGDSRGGRVMPGLANGCQLKSRQTSPKV